MPHKMITGLVLVLVGLCVILWDIVTILSKNKGDRIGEVISIWTKRKPIIGFVVGVLMGHLFWPQ